MRDFHLPGRSAVYADNGICATSHPLAAKVAIDTLEAGGNAVDAAIAASAMLALCEPAMTGLAGDLFALITPPGESRVVALNASGRAPAATDPDRLRAEFGTAIPTRSVHTVTLPGAVDGMVRLSDDWGRLGLDRLFAPAIRYAEEGVPVAPRVAFDWQENQDVFQGAARDHYLDSGAALTPGQRFRAPGQAEVLRRIAAEGRDGFYSGAVAGDLIGSLRAMGGCHTLDDLAAVRADYTDPISAPYRGTELIEHAPNGQGATALLLANILSHFDIASMDPMGAERAHIEAEAAKLAYDARGRFIADPGHTTRLAHMLAPETAASLAALIDPARAMPHPPLAANAVHQDTVYLTVIDRDRMAVSLIYSIFWAFGTGLASDKFGLLFQNRGAGFSLEPGHPNEAGPGKRPLHTIIPGMLRRDGALLASFGVMGGGYQPTGHARVLSNMVDFGMDPQSAIDAPRAYADGPVLKVERGYAPDVAQALADLGHDITTPNVPLGGAQMVMIGESGGLIGASDPRKDGIALGY